MKTKQSEKILNELIAMREDKRWKSNAVYYDVLCQFIGDFNYEGANIDLAWFQNGVKHDLYIPDKSNQDPDPDDYSDELKEEISYLTDNLEDFDEAWWENTKEPHYYEMPSQVINELRKEVYRKAVKRIFSELEYKMLWGKKKQ